MAGEFVQSFTLVRKKFRVSRFKGSILSLSMFVRSKMGYVRAKLCLTGQFDRSQPGNYLQPCRGSGYEGMQGGGHLEDKVGR